jgi:hypothetical protein
MIRMPLSGTGMRQISACRVASRIAGSIATAEKFKERKNKMEFAFGLILGVWFGIVGRMLWEGFLRDAQIERSREIEKRRREREKHDADSSM